LIPAFNAVIGVIAQVRDAFNSLAGTNLSGLDVVLLALVARWLGIFGLLRVGILATLSGLGALILEGLTAALAPVAYGLGVAALFTPVGLVIGGAIIAGILVGMNWDTIVAKFNEFTAQLAADWNATIQLWKGYLSAFADWFMSTWVGQILSAIAKVIAAIAAMLSMLPGTPSGSLGSPAGAGAPGFARGGVLGGHSGTDTNLGLFTKGEYLVNTEATAKNKPLLDMINFGGLKGYALGGLVGSIASAFMMPARIPAYAGGGPIATSGGTQGGGRGLTLIFGDKSFDLHGSRSTVDDIERHAVFTGMARLGPDPSWNR